MGLFVMCLSMLEALVFILLLKCNGLMLLLAMNKLFFHINGILWVFSSLIWCSTLRLRFMGLLLTYTVLNLSTSTRWGTSPNACTSTFSPLAEQNNRFFSLILFSFINISSLNTVSWSLRTYQIICVINPTSNFNPNLSIRIPISITTLLTPHGISEK